MATVSKSLRRLFLTTTQVTCRNGSWKRFGMPTMTRVSSFQYSMDQTHAKEETLGTDINSLDSKTKKKMEMVTKETATKGSDKPLFEVSSMHYLTRNSMYPPFPSHMRMAIFGMGCFWSAENCFLGNVLNGIYSTQVGYMGGYTPNPTYSQVKNNETGHIEVVRVIYDPNIVKYTQLLKLFWEKHNPCQGMRQGDDYGTQYRSAIFYTSENQAEKAKHSKKEYEETIRSKFENEVDKIEDVKVTTEILDGRNFEFYYAEDYHQQYFVKNPNEVGQCSMRGLGVDHQLKSVKPLYCSEEMAKEFNTNKKKQDSVLEPDDTKFRQLENLYNEGIQSGSQREH